MKPLIYLAGPITKPDPNVNAHRAIRLADDLMYVYPITLFIPQLSVLHQIVEPKTHDEWLEYDFGVIEACDAMLRIPGPSVGADMEEHWADAIGIPVFALDEYGQPGARFGDWLRDWHDAWEQGRDRMLDLSKDRIRKWGAAQRAAHADYGHVTQ